MTNNSLVDLPDNLFDNLKLASLFLDGNRLKSIPQSVFDANTLRNFKIANNDISNIPVEIKNLKQLYDIDLRNNTISSLPTVIESLKSTLKYIYLHNNPICTNGWLDENKNAKEMIEKSGTLESGAAGCKAQCSIYCQDRYLTMKNQGCARDCNSKVCDFYGGKCKV
jgi:Leucine-rich repeat (LRR) protein